MIILVSLELEIRQPSDDMVNIIKGVSVMSTSRPDATLSEKVLASQSKTK